MKRIFLTLCLVLLAVRGMAEQSQNMPRGPQGESGLARPTAQDVRPSPGSSSAPERLVAVTTVRVSGWLSTVGPMEFDRMMDAWKTEIGHKVLTGVEMAPSGLVGVWKIQPRHKEALANRLQDAAKAQGLTVEIK